MELYIDLKKAINRSKLVQKRTMVRGKNGKIYYRMQWVDPRTGQPVSEPRGHVEAEPTEHRTQKEHIDAHVKAMSREEKYNHLSKHGIDWKHNDHPAIDHKNAVEALKQHLYANPHLAGAEHLPKELDHGKTPDGTDKVNDFLNKHKKTPEKLYRMMKHLGVTEDDTDPRTVDGQQHPSKGGNGKGDIMHMKNMMALKRHFKENPSKLDEMMNHPEFGINGQGASPSVATPPKPAPTKNKAQNTAQKGGNTIKGILDSMSSEDKYALCKKLGIAEGDPRLDPSIDAKMRPIHHMRNMMELKKAVERDPSLLNIDPVTGGLNDAEKERINGLKGKEELAEKVHDFLNRASRDLKLQWADDYADHEYMKNRHTSTHDNVDKMHKIATLKKILMDDPSIMDELKPELEREELSNLKIGNKTMGKILREVAGLKGIGDITAGYDKGREWEFGDESSAMIQEDDEGEPILSIYHIDKDGKEHDLAIPMSKVKKYLDGLKSGEKTEIKSQELPLHKKPLKAIWDALNTDFDKNYTKEVGDVLKQEVSKMWEASGNSSIPASMARRSVIPVEPSTLEKLFNKYGVKINSSPFVKTVDSNSDAFRRVVWGHKIEKVKSKNAMDYLQEDDGNNTWVLHESAKHWTPEERAEARKDFIKGNLHIEGLERYKDAEDRKVMFTNHVHKSLDLVPFDLFTDVIAAGMSSFHVKDTDEDGHKTRGNYHSTVLRGIKFDHGYIDDLNSLSENHPMYHRPSPRPMYDDKGNDTGQTAGFHPFSDTVAHEFAHAIDSYLSGNNGSYSTWNTPQGQKYAGKHTDVIHNSYDAAVNKSNPNKMIGRRGGSQKYIYHLDEWMTHYEGRIYDNKYYRNPTQHLDKLGNVVYDKSWDNRDERGLEHWSENVSRVFNAIHAYKQWMDDGGDPSIGMDSWAEKMHNEYTGEGYGDESNSRDGKGYARYLTSYRYGGNGDRNKPINKMPIQTYGYLYHTMKQRHPEMFKGIHDILVRPDFLGDKSVADPISRAEKGDYVRKSNVDLIINLEELL